MRTRELLAAVVLGVISDLAFDPVNLPGAMIVGVAGLLLLLLRNPSARKSYVASLGAAFGVGFFGPLLWWMNAVGHGAYAGIVLSQIGFSALLAIGLGLVMRLRWWPVWGASLWIGVELLRSNFPFSGFPWGRLAFSGAGTPIESYARLVGVPGMGAVMFLVAASIAYFAFHPGATTGLMMVATGSTMLLFGALLPTGVAGEQGTRQVALVQGDVPGLKGHWKPGQIFQKHADETENLIAAIALGNQPQPDFVLWPENSTDIDPAQFPSVSGLLDLLVRGLEAPILVGGLLNGPDSGTAYNAGLVWTRGGAGDKYIKRKPVPFGEYVPFRSVLGEIVPRFGRLIPR
ncbi:MAG: apolipoprotein N-acyltransferase, partial [Aeromicrobium sp.]